MASGSKDQTVRVWDVASGQLQTTLTGHIWPVGRVVFLPDGKRLASVSADLSVRIWDTETGQLENSFEWSGRNAIALAPNGNLIAAESGRTVKLIDLTTGKVSVTLQGDTGVPLCMDSTPDGSALIVGGTGVKLGLWDVETGQVRTTFQLREDNVESLSVSPDGRLLATCSYRNRFELWDTTTGKRSRAVETHGGNVRCVAFAPDGKLAVANSNATVAIWSNPD